MLKDEEWQCVTMNVKVKWHIALQYVDEEEVTRSISQELHVQETNAPLSSDRVYLLHPPTCIPAVVST